jgi:hypothetical protein
MSLCQKVAKGRPYPDIFHAAFFHHILVIATYSTYYDIYIIEFVKNNVEG